MTKRKHEHLLKELEELRRHNLDGILATPRDLTRYIGPNTLLQEDNFRYKGYPNGFFEKSSQPVIRHSIATETPSSKEKDIVEPQTPQSQEIKYTYGLPRYFDTYRPKAFQDNKGLQYGSENLPVNTQEPKPVRDPFHEKTSAQLKKFRHEQDEVDEEIKKFKQEKQLKLMSMEHEKKKDLEQLKSYNPWGKPGAGAPNPNGEFENKKQKFEETTVAQPTSPPMNKQYIEEYGDFHSRFGRPGAGAPLRTENGEVKADYKGDTSIRFQDTTQGRKIYDNEVRYTDRSEEDKQQYYKELDDQVRKKTLTEQEHRMQELRKELEMLKHNPYGKPGAGAPNKTKSEEDTRSQNRMASGFEYYDPWGKGTGQAVRDAHGDVQRHSYSDKYGVNTRQQLQQQRDPDEGTTLAFDNNGGGGAPMKTISGNVKTRLPITMRRDERGDTNFKDEVPGTKRSLPNGTADPEHSVYDPWGRGGGGAPLKDVEGHVISGVYGKLKNERSSADMSMKINGRHQYLLELQREMEESKKNRDHNDQELKAGAGELASIMKQGLVGKPRRDPNTGMLSNQHLGGTDVTYERTNTRRLLTKDSTLYHTELEKAANERRHNMQLDKLKDNQEAKSHQNAFSNVWGKPGGGAPNGPAAQKANLDEMLYSPRTQRDYNLLAPYAQQAEEVL